ncbi:MAG: prephenate dehydrogenase/arogenate dehydrogenase family protein [Phycisphaerae bacterium]|nr:prephenate dehydrogenase/arogenate dehydrogenase family protein [Phycisphaerae bacterium]MDW8262422.1 prephenate dehydrogenase/arogenate dehydrogenase family protein [Phycisphaerales bacterium]
MKIRRLSIIGLGLIGTSIALAARKRVSGCQITGYDISRQALHQALRNQAVHRVAPDPAQCAADCELLLLAVPIRQVPGVFRKIRKTLPTGAIITDTCSTKRGVLRLARQWLPHPRRFVGSHPMFGGTSRGGNEAHWLLAQGARCLITPAGANPAAVQVVEDFWRQLGLVPMRTSPIDHDRLVARASHLPQMLASVLMGLQTERSIRLSGPGLRDTTRLAGSDPALWTEILLDNADFAAEALHSTTERLRQLSHALRAGDARTVARILRAGQRMRNRLMQPAPIAVSRKSGRSRLRGLG